MSEAFLELGGAEEFANLPMEEKLAKIAEGYDSNTNKAEALATLVKIMASQPVSLFPCSPRAEMP